MSCYDAASDDNKELWDLFDRIQNGARWIPDGVGWAEDGHLYPAVYVDD